MQSVTIKASSLNHNVWRHMGEYALGLVLMGLHANLCLYKIALETKVIPRVKRIIKKSDSTFQQTGVPAYTATTVQNWLDAHMSFWAKDLFKPHSHQI